MPPGPDGSAPISRLRASPAKLPTPGIVSCKVNLDSMGRFASTVSYYRQFREPYPPAFFRRTARILRLDGSQTLLDLGCGPGLLALGFAPFVRRLTGVDPEPAMLTDARAAARTAGVALRLIQRRAENLPASTGSYDVVTIGRALHWLTRDRALAALDRLVRPQGAIVVCSATSEAGRLNPWRHRYDRLRHRAAPEKNRRRYQLETATFFDGTPFCLRRRVAVRLRQTITVDGLVGRLFSMSNTSPAKLGRRAHLVATRLRAALAPFVREDGGLTEVVVARAAIFTRRG